MAGRIWEPWEIDLAMSNTQCSEVSRLTGRSVGSVKTKRDYERNKSKRLQSKKNMNGDSVRMRRRETYHRDRKHRLCVIKDYRDRNRDRVRETNRRSAIPRRDKLTEAQRKRRIAASMATSMIQLQLLSVQLMEKMQ